MKRWYIFFLIVAVLAALGSLGIFSGSVEHQTEGPAGPGKLLFLTLLAVGGTAYAGWLAFSSSARKRRQDEEADARDRGESASIDADAARIAGWQPPQPPSEKRPPDNPPR